MFGLTTEASVMTQVYLKVLLLSQFLKLHLIFITDTQILQKIKKQIWKLNKWMTKVFHQKQTAGKTVAEEILSNFCV